VIELIAERAPEPFERLALAGARQRVELDAAPRQPELEPDQLVAARRRKEFVGGRGPDDGMCRGKVTVAREQRCRFGVVDGEARVTA
jgi:hypothetical protein